MQIRDLIEELKKCDPQAIAGISTRDGEFYAIDTVVPLGSSIHLIIPDGLCVMDDDGDDD